MNNYDIKKFDFTEFCKALSNDQASQKQLESNSRVDYLYRYLDELGTRTIIIESDYIDGGYLEDYSSYYSRCFEEYDRFCKRIHFFSCTIDNEIFDRFILGNIKEKEEAAIFESYSGFVVARPLPERVIGRTALRTYPSDKGRRQYRAVVDVHSNLYGADFTVRSLPFQEQDNVVAACATVSLWSALQKTAKLFNSRAPRPAVITRTANQVVNRDRPVPSEGLDLRQVAHAVRSVDLVPEVFDVKETTPLISLLYAYLEYGLPIILSAEVDNELHAVTITGYSKRVDRIHDSEIATSVSYSPPTMEGLWIDEVYAHDDGIGPFSRLSIVSGTTDCPVKFESDWPDLFSPHAVIIPVYEKIRVTFLDIQEWLARLAPIMRVLFTHEGDGVRWDVQLTDINTLKKRLRSDRNIKRSIGSDKVKSLLLGSQPRFIWRIEANHADTKLFEILADATDMRTSFPAYNLIPYNESFMNELSRVIKLETLRNTLYDILGPPLFEFLKEQT